jgi:hypothetical protein
MSEGSFKNNGVTKNTYVAIKQTTSKHVICQVLKV